MSMAGETNQVAFSVGTFLVVARELCGDAVCFAGLLDDLYRFSPVSSVWERVAQDARLTARAQHRISALGGRIYLFGGFGDSGMCLSLAFG